MGWLEQVINEAAAYSRPPMRDPGYIWDDIYAFCVPFTGLNAAGGELAYGMVDY